ncbi:MAG: hypothetical protein CL917_17780 [Deltaproteobacteria bacterium]|nr:hypothetical protein [Deltaproteobacteria bacterium]
MTCSEDLRLPGRTNKTKLASAILQGVSNKLRASLPRTESSLQSKFSYHEFTKRRADSKYLTTIYHWPNPDQVNSTRPDSFGASVQFDRVVELTRRCLSQQLSCLLGFFRDMIRMRGLGCWHAQRLPGVQVQDLPAVQSQGSWGECIGCDFRCLTELFGCGCPP